VSGRVAVPSCIDAAFLCDDAEKSINRGDQNCIDAENSSALAANNSIHALVKCVLEEKSCVVDEKSSGGGDVCCVDGVNRFIAVAGGDLVPLAFGGGALFGRDWPGLAPAGDFLSCVAKKGSKEGDPASPVIRCANDSPALLPAGGRRGTRPSGSDSRAGLPRLLLRCSAGRNGLFGYTEPLRNLSRALAVDHLHFLSPLARRLEVMTGGKRASHV